MLCSNKPMLFQFTDIGKYYVTGLFIISMFLFSFGAKW